MLKEIRSKYQAKHYEEIEYELEEQVCPKCDRPYMVDTRYCKTKTIFDADWELKICPYCGYKHYVCI